MTENVLWLKSLNKLHLKTREGKREERQSEHIDRKRERERERGERERERERERWIDRERERERKRVKKTEAKNRECSADNFQIQFST